MNSDKILIDRAVVEQALEALEYEWGGIPLGAVRERIIEALREALSEAALYRMVADAQRLGLYDEPSQAPCSAAEDGVCEALECCQRQEPIGPEWKPCVKLPVTVHVREQRPGETHVSTREGITPVKPDDLIMRGVAGEEYPIGRELFERTYRMGELRQEPVLTMNKMGTLVECSPKPAAFKLPDGEFALYTNPAQQPVELTDEEIADIAKATETAEPGRDGYILPHSFARAVIAAYRAKQGEQK